MNKVKNLSMALTVIGLGAASSFAEIKVTDNLSLSGFFDMSGGAVLDGAAETESYFMGFDQFELDLAYSYGDVSANVDLNYWAADPALEADLGGNPVVLFEQGYVTYSKNGMAVMAGKFLSSTGFEAAEPTGLYQYSTSKTLVYGGYQNGLALSYGTEMFALYGAVVGSVWDGLDTDPEYPGVEAQISLMPVEGLTAKVAYAGDIMEDYTKSLINAWASYSMGSVTVAGEFNYLMNWDAEDINGMGYLAMVNFGLGANAACTIRYSGIMIDEVEDGDPNTEVTLSPSLALTDNLGTLAEVRYDIEDEVTSFAVEAILTY
jgi:hypothetical protein